MELAWLLFYNNNPTVRKQSQRYSDHVEKKNQMREFLELEVSFTIILPLNLLTFLMASTPLP